MVRQETIEFVRENRSLLREVAENGDPAISSLAAAFLAAVPPGDEKASSLGQGEGNRDGGTAR